MSWDERIGRMIQWVFWQIDRLAEWMNDDERPTVEAMHHAQMHPNCHCAISPVIDEEPLMVDASLVFMKPEIGITFQKYPTVWEIATRLSIDVRQATWIWHTCKVTDSVYALLMLNDVARAIRDGMNIDEVQRRALVVMQASDVWRRET
jgi:hypothetical protein